MSGSTGQRATTDDGGVPDVTPKYEGNRFPWWLLIIWLAFLWWAVSYFIEWTGPEYSEWFEKPAEVTHRPMHK